ncbi:MULTISPECIES: TlpA disulfide reductase family protein [unclassified Thioalkalivibrio]|uniref:TlpA family protein disulfide reductase n=1 Tax=unclassified Thioalkalivibrio TaxID=2621013 RepID=UPI00037E3C53|nr:MULTISPECIES: TlpA disulfide reductase family protein [unclassified Thioalkalivibrio]
MSVLPRLGLLLCLILAAPVLADVAEPRSMTVTDPAGVELDVTVYPAEGERLYLWLLPQAGAHANHAEFGRELAALGIEVWQVDLLDAHFLPRTNESMRSLDGVSVAALLRAAHEETGKEVMLVASGRPAITALRGLRQWQEDGPEAAYVLGAALAFPNLMVDTPVAGAPAEFVDVVRATSLPVFLLQPTQGVYRWHLDEILTDLRRGGSAVFVRMIPGVRDFYYLRRSDPEPEEVAMAARLPAQLLQAGRLLASVPSPLAAAPMPELAHEVEAGRGLVARDHPPPVDDFTLTDHLGDEQSLSDYAGQVVLLNFWASWCPPCVHEIPSMNRMAKTLGTGFAIVSVNYQESAEHISAFMDEVQVDFPVLMDFDGRVAADWRVFAFPSSFILGRDGRVRYSVNSAIEWDDPDVINRVRTLMTEPE